MANPKTGTQLELEIEGKPYRVQIVELTSDRARVSVNDREIAVSIRQAEPPDGPADRAAADPAPAPMAPSFAAPAPRPQAAAPAERNKLRALMPGVVVRVMVQEGQSVQAGEVLLVLEAMKMENQIRSDRPGNIQSSLVSVGQQVQTGDPLVSFS